MEYPHFQFCPTLQLSSYCKENDRNILDHLPTQSEEDATGYDLRAAEDVSFDPLCYKRISLGVKMIAPKGWWLEMRPRSSTVAKLNLHCLYGVIDQNYTGEMMLVAQWIPDSNMMLRKEQQLKIKAGDRICQVIPVRLERMQVSMIDEERFKELAKEREKLRDKAGFGSSGIV